MTKQTKENLLKELAEAKERLENTEIGGSRGNNPNKNRALIQDLRLQIHTLTEQGKAMGFIELTDHDKLERELDKHFPDTPSNKVVEFEGKKYIRKFWPLVKSNSGKTVTMWGKGWQILPDQD